MSGLSRAMEERGHEVTEAWAEPGAGPGRASNEWILPLEVTAGSTNLPAARALGSAAGSLARLARGLARRRPDVVNVHFLMGQCVYFLMLRKIFGYRVVLSAHGSDVLRPSDPCRKYLPYFFRKADATTVVSSHLQDEARKLAGDGARTDRIRLVPNGVDVDFWSAAPRDPSETPTLVTAGRLERVKGFDVLLDAFAEVRERAPSARLVLAGDGAERASLIARARELGVLEGVEFAGHLAPHELRARLARASVFVLPSRSEGMPLALIEAMAAGVPVVATRVGGVPEVVHSGTGRLVEPERPPELARAVLDVLRDDALARHLSKEGRARAEAFSRTKTHDAYERVFESAGRRAGSAR